MSQIENLDQQSSDNEKGEIESNKFTSTLLETQQQRIAIEDESIVRMISIDDFDRAKYVMQSLSLDFKLLQQAKQNSEFKYYRQGFYYGELLNNFRHGFGLMVYQQEAKLYIGEWENDKKFGQGKEGNEESYYEGAFLNGKPHGFGIYKSKEDSYEGYWLNGLRHGYGKQINKQGDTYQGQWSQGNATGQGKILYATGNYYEGDFQNFYKHGKGFEKFENGDFYEGEYINGKPDGFGIYTWFNGSCYQGQFCGGLRHGKGFWQKDSSNPQSDSYEGEYVNDKKSGKGIYRWQSGSIYEGDFFDDFRHGFGEMKWPNGSLYKGSWIRGMQDGNGEYCTPGKEIINGIFEKNKVLVNFNQNPKQKRAYSATVRFRINNSLQHKIEKQFNHPQEMVPSQLMTQKKVGQQISVLLKPLANDFKSIHDNERHLKTQNSNRYQTDTETVKKVVIESHYFNKRLILGQNKSNLRNQPTPLKSRPLILHYN